MRKILRLYYMLFDYDGIGSNASRGKFRVKYPDGKVSIKMSYWTAKDYKNIFGGEIIDAF